jgi:hypothetical protein
MSSVPVRGPPPKSTRIYKRFYDEDGDPFFLNVTTGESVWRLPIGSILVRRTPEEDKIVAENRAKAMQKREKAKQEEKDRQADRKERETAGLEQAKARADYAAEQAERERLRATETSFASTSEPTVIIPPEERIALGNRLLAMGFKQLRRYFGFPEMGLSKTQEKELEKKAKKFLGLNFSPDKNPNNEVMQGLYEQLNAHFGSALGSPSKARIIGGKRKQTCPICGMKV